MFEKYLTLALELSIAMIKNGGEIYRAEECARSVLRAAGAEKSEVFALPTGITITAMVEGEYHTRVASLKSRVNNLGNIDIINTISREIDSGDMDVDTAFEKLRGTEEIQSNNLRRIIFSSLTAGSFTVVFGGGLLELVLAIFTALFAQVFIALLKRIDTVSFLYNMGGAIITALISKVFLIFFPDIEISTIIIGGIMPMLPGLMTINAIRDTLNGDLVSGAARGIDALLSAVAIAAGVGVVLAF